MTTHRKNTATSSASKLATVPGDESLFLHYLGHSVMLGLYFLSPWLSLGLEMHPFSESFHGMMMWGSMFLIAPLAYGPPYTAQEQGSIRWYNAYRRVISPGLFTVSVLGLVALWIFALHESFAGSLLA